VLFVPVKRRMWLLSGEEVTRQGRPAAWWTADRPGIRRRLGNFAGNQTLGKSCDEIGAGRRCCCAFVRDALRDSRRLRLLRPSCLILGVHSRQLLDLLSHCPFHLSILAVRNLSTPVDRADLLRHSIRSPKHPLQKSHSTPLLLLHSTKF